MGSSIHNQRDAPAHGVIDITPADSDLALEIRAFYVGVTGNVKVTAQNGTTATFVAVPAGQWMPVTCTRIWSTGTTASSITGVY